MRMLGRHAALVSCALLIGVSCGSEATKEGTPLRADAETIIEAAATAMGSTTSVHFELKRSGAAVYIDQFESLALEKIVGRYSGPSSVDAALTVTVDGSLKTKLGAVAIGDTVWLSNPVTGKFETLPKGYDIDPSTFFDPDDGWQPLLAELQDVVLVGVENRGGGKRYHMTGVAPAERIESVTAGLVRDQDVAMDFWFHRDTGLVSAAEFSTTFDGKTTKWVLELSQYGKSFTIKAPDVDG
jgi:LppX_LprAFG lipoprotein